MLRHFITTFDVFAPNMVIISIIVNGKNIDYDDICIAAEAGMAELEWQNRVKGLLKAELKRRNVGYRELADRLTALGVPESERNIANKIARGGFTAVFLVQCLVAIGCEKLDLGH